MEYQGEKAMTKKELEAEVKRLIDLAHKALGAREPNHQVSCRGLGREYIEAMVNAPSREDEE
jgi:hypothetical protein